MTGTGNDRLARAPAVEPRASIDPIESRRVRWYACALFALGATAGLVLVVVGAPLPSLWPVVLLGSLIALSLNQLAFFPSEWSATAEAAVLIAAVVGFAGGAGANGGNLQTDPALLGPWLVALLCGPLDAVHWRQRAFWRMAYNSGNRMVAALLAALAFEVVAGLVSTLWLAFACAALAASMVLAFVDLGAFVVFEQLRERKPVRDAVRDDLLYDCLTVPLGLFGAFAGWVAVESGWWAGALALLPAPFVPELVLGRARRALRHGSFARHLGRAGPVLTGAALVIVVLALVEPFPSAGELIGLVAVALFAGLELGVNRRSPVPPMVAALVIAGLVVNTDAEVASAVIAAVVATATATIAARSNRWWAPALAAGAAGVAAAVFDARPSRGSALAAALVFEVVLLTRLSNVVWTAPLVAAAVALAFLWRAIGTGAAAVFAVCMLVTAAAAATWGRPPWNSRVLGPWATRVRVRIHRAMLLTAGALAFALAIIATLASPTREVFVFGASAAVCAAATMAAVGVRQWRFAPRPRARHAALLFASAVASVLAYPALALDGDKWSIVIVALSVALSVVAGWTPARLAQAAATRSDDQPRKVETR